MIAVKAVVRVEIKVTVTVAVKVAVRLAVVLPLQKARLLTTTPMSGARYQIFRNIYSAKQNNNKRTIYVNSGKQKFCFTSFCIASLSCVIEESCSDSSACDWLYWVCKPWRKRSDSDTLLTKVEICNTDNMHVYKSSTQKKGQYPLYNHPLQ